VALGDLRCLLGTLGHPHRRKSGAGAGGGRRAYGVRVTDAARAWQPDVLDGFEQTTLVLPDSWDGPVETVLVRRAAPLTEGAAVLYVHGFGDYFFQDHLADWFESQGLRFYALDLRRHGRALREHQHPNTCRSIDEYLEDVDAAIDVLTGEEGVEWLLVNGHSTGGLTVSVHAARGRRRDAVGALFLNSPWLDFGNVVGLQHALLPVIAAVGKVLPELSTPSTDPTYVESVHSAYRGEWDFDLAWKPLVGFPTWLSWIGAIRAAHGEVSRGLGIAAPVLLLRSTRSLRPKAWSDEVQRADIVLDVDDMVRQAPNLGAPVEMHAVPDGMHDLVLSREHARNRTFALVADWLGRIRP